MIAMVDVDWSVLNLTHFVRITPYGVIVGSGNDPPLTVASHYRTNVDPFLMMLCGIQMIVKCMGNYHYNIFEVMDLNLSPIF